MSLEIWWIGKKGSSAEVNHFLSRIQKYTKIQEVFIKDSKKSNPADRKQEEAKNILSRLKQEDHLILMDETGEQFTSKKWSLLMNNKWMRKKKSIFLIGGSYGVDHSIFERANDVLALSKLTFPHEMARLILVEQLYRSFTILNNEKYHHE